MANGVNAFVRAFLVAHPSPEPPLRLPEELLANATFDQADIERWHFANEDAYTDFPNLTLSESAQFDRLVRIWSERREFVGTSPQGMGKRLRRLFVDCLNEPDRAAELTTALISALETTPLVDVLLPITGVDLRVPEWVLGPDVRLVAMTPERFEADVVGGYVRGAAQGMPVYGGPESHGRGMAVMLEKAFVGGPVLVVRAEGDEYVAQDAAEKRADIVVDALQFAAAVFNHERWRTFIDWTGDVPASGWRLAGQIPVAGDVRPNNPGSRRGMLAPWTVDEAQLAAVVETRVDAVIEAALATPAAEHQDMIRRAVRAFADGERQRSVDGKKLSYTTVFDIFFSVKDTADTTRSIREGVAFTMYGRQSLNERFEQAQFINRVYESRSRTSHEFETGVFEEGDLARLRMIAYNLIGVLSRRKSFAKAGLREEIDAERTAMGAEYERFENLGRPKDPQRDD